MKFGDFAGNGRIVDYFRKAVLHGHLGHAYLCSGQEGVGKASFARCLSNALVCQHPSAENGPCGQCASCRKFDSNNHPDFHPFAPDGTYFKIDQVRAIIHQVSYKPVEAKWKLFLLEGVEYMREEASNALLKVLEEPPGETIFFLITVTPESLLPTILSRCQHFPFLPVEQEVVVRYLVDHTGLDQEEATARARFCHGSIGRALAVNVEQYREMRDRVLGALEAALLPRTYFQLFEAIKSITVERSGMAERFLILEELARDLILLKTDPDSGRFLMHEDVRQRLSVLASSMRMPAFHAFYERLLQTREAVIKINANTTLALQSLFLPLRLAS
jgi:DNA polymerase-3 subunit delta'